MADDPPTAPPRRRRPSAAATFAAILAVFTLVLAGGAWYALRLVQRLPARIAEEGRELGRDAVATVDALVRGFRTGEVQRRFSAYTTRVEGTNYLQVATLQQLQTFERQDDATLLWGTVELPPVVVRATAPVDYTYYVDLEKPWQLDLVEADRRVVVRAPGLQYNKPAIDISQLRWQVVRGSLIRDEQQVAAELRREMMGRAGLQARTNLPLVRDTARRQVQHFVSQWLLQSFEEDARGYSVEVFFADEEAAWRDAMKPAAVAPPG